MTQRYCDPLIMQTHDLQELSKTYHIIATGQDAPAACPDHPLLTLYWPEIERFWFDATQRWFIRLLMRFRRRDRCGSDPAAVRHNGLGGSWVAAYTSRQDRGDFYGLAARSIALPIEKTLGCPDVPLAVGTLPAAVPKRVRLLRRSADALLGVAD